MRRRVREGRLFYIMEEKIQVNSGTREKDYLNY